MPYNSNMKDSIQRFLFEHAPVRGEIVRLDAAWRAVLERRAYPPPVHRLLGEMTAAAALLTATLKFDGTLIMQIQGSGPVRLLVVECTSDHHLRATAKCGDVPATAGTLRELVGDGKFAITLDRGPDRQSYQGVVALEGDSVATVLEHYMERSEQIATRMWLAADDGCAAGFMLQQLPGANDADPDAWQRATLLAASLTPRELLALDARELLHRLYSVEDIRLFDVRRIDFRCSCTRARVSAMLRMLGHAEVRGIISERGYVEVDCEFCNEHYRFDAVDAEQTFATAHNAPAASTRH